MSKNRPNDYLGVNKIGKNIRKTSLHQPNFINSSSNSGNLNNPGRQQPQPQVYNISKNDFRSIVQQLTGSPVRQDPLPMPKPPNNPPKHLSTRLQRIRPPPLTPINRPPMQMQPPPRVAPPPVTFNNNRNFVGLRSQFGQPSPRGMNLVGPTDWITPALSPISAYMQQLQRCISDGGQVQGQQPPSSGLLPNPSFPPLPSPRMNVPPGLLPSPRMNGAPGLLPSPTSEFPLPSPSGFLNLLSPTPRSPYPLLSPGSQFPPPLSPNFSFSHIGQSGILGAGPQPPLSPGIVFPLSPFGFFPISSPRWRDR